VQPEPSRLNPSATANKAVLKLHSLMKEDGVEMIASRRRESVKKKFHLI
jgi:hypothetical protein